MSQENDEKERFTLESLAEKHSQMAQAGTIVFAK